MVLYGQEMEQVGEFVTDSNSDWQNMTLTSDDGSVFNYIGEAFQSSEVIVLHARAKKKR